MKRILFCAFFFSLVIIASCDIEGDYMVGTGMEGTMRDHEFFVIKPVSKLEADQVVEYEIKRNGQIEKLVSRIAAIAGDTLRVRDASLVRNHHRVTDPYAAKFLYHLTSNSTNKKKWIKDDGGYFLEDSSLMLFLQQGVSDYPLDTFEREIERIIYHHYFKTDSSVVSDSMKNWSCDNFGPIWIPKKGERIRIDSSNFKLFSQLFTADDISYSSPGKIDFTLSDDCVFLIGDNRYHTFDSRYHGFVYVHQIKGVVDNE